MPELNLTEWLKAEDIGTEATIYFIDVGEKTEIPLGDGKQPKPAFEIGVRLQNGENRRWTMNETSQKAVAQSYGKNTDLWINKPVTVFTQDQNVQGTMRKVIYARVPASAPAPSAQIPKSITCGECDFMDESARGEHCKNCRHNQFKPGSFDNFIQR